MKKLLLSVLALIFMLPASAAGQQLPPREETLKTLIKVNDLYLKNHPDPTGMVVWPTRHTKIDASAIRLSAKVSLTRPTGAVSTIM